MLRSCLLLKSVIFTETGTILINRRYILCINVRMARRSDGEEEVALVDVANAAASSLFSPNMWVRRPSRTPGAYHMDEEGPHKDM